MSEKNNLNPREDFEKDFNEEIEKENNVYRANKKSVKRTRNRRIITGGIFCVLAFVGVMTIFTGVVKAGVKLFDKSFEMQKYENMLSTLVIYDPLPFESVEEADQNVILSSTLWAAVMNEDMSVYEKDEYDRTLLPAAVVDKYYTALFGPDHKLEHKTFTDQDMEFEYNSEKRAYAIPVTSYPSGYSPKVVKIHTKSGVKTVTVAYLSPSTSWDDTSDRSIAKYVDYIFTKNDSDKEYYLTAVRESSIKVEIADSPSSSSSSSSSSRQ